MTHTQHDSIPRTVPPAFLPVCLSPQNTNSRAFPLCHFATLPLLYSSALIAQHSALCLSLLFRHPRYSPKNKRGSGTHESL